MNKFKESGYRILQEVDENLNDIESVAVYNTETKKIEQWFGTKIAAKEWIESINGDIASAF